MNEIQESIQSVETTNEFSPPPVQSSNKKTIALIISLSILLIAALAVAAFLYFQNHTLSNLLETSNLEESNVQNAETPAAQINTVFASTYNFGKEIEQVFNEVMQSRDGKIVRDYPNDHLRLWWVSDDGLNIIDDDVMGTEYHDYSCSEDKGTRVKFNEVSEILTEKITPVMKKYGFIQNQRNSSVSIDDKQFYDYVQAYEKGEVKCILTASPDCSTYDSGTPYNYSIAFTCSSEINKRYAEQSKFLKDLDIKSAVIRVVDTVDNFAKINVNYRRTGHEVIAKLENGAWVEISSGQDDPDCRDMEEHQVPKALYGDCYIYKQRP